ncbi:MAG: hypothetical protein H7Y30_02425 [Pyrinomonadaceae bacterium]|nr:hypothetical protein [Pyrinomonadaceae bacterium]
MSWGQRVARTHLLFAHFKTYLQFLDRLTGERVFSVTGRNFADCSIFPGEHSLIAGELPSGSILTLNTYSKGDINMRKNLLIIALCILSFAAGTFLTGTKAAPVVTEDPDFEANVTAGYVTIEWQTGVNYLSVDNASESPEVAVNLSLSTITGSFQNIENGRQYRLLLIPVEER